MYVIKTTVGWTDFSPASEREVEVIEAMEEGEEVQLKVRGRGVCKGLLGFIGGYC